MKRDLRCRKCRKPTVDAYVLWPDGRKFLVCESCRRKPEFIKRYRNE